MTAHSDYPSQDIQPTISQSISQRLSAWLGTAWKVVWCWMFVEYPEPQITERRGRKGRLYWEIYDPITGKTAYCGTDDEVRTWLDTRHYQR